MEEIRIVLWGNDSYNSLGVLRQLGGHNVFFLINRRNNHLCTSSRYCKQYLVVKDVAEGLRFLINEASFSNNRTILIPTNDYIAEAIDVNRDSLSKRFVFSTTLNKNDVVRFSDKYVMSGLARECGLTIPKTILVDKHGVSSLDLPCVIKPLKTEEKKNKPFKVRYCYSQDDLERVVEALHDGYCVLAQSLINKDRDILLYGCRMRDGSIIIPGCFIKYRWDISGDGSFGELRGELPLSINVEQVKEFIIRVGYYGLFSVEFGEKNGTAFFYEANFRNDGTSHYFYQAGVNMLKVWLLDLMGGPVSNEMTSIAGVHYFIDEIGDYDNVKSKKCSRKQWKNDYKRSTIFKYKDWSDMKPYLRLKYRLLLHDLFRPLIPLAKRVLKR